MSICHCQNTSNKQYKGDRSTFRESNNSTGFASLLSRGQLLKERICSTRSKFFSFRGDPIQRAVFYPEKHNGILQGTVTLFSKK